MTTPITTEAWVDRFFKLPEVEQAFVLRVLRSYGAKGAAEPYYDNADNALWKAPEEAGLIIAEGSYKFISTVDLYTVLCWVIKALQPITKHADPLDVATQAVQQPTLVAALTLAARHAAPEALEQAIRMTIAMWIEAGGLEEWDQAALCAARAARAAAAREAAPAPAKEAIYSSPVFDKYQS